VLYPQPLELRPQIVVGHLVPPLSIAHRSSWAAAAHHIGRPRPPRRTAQLFIAERAARPLPHVVCRMWPTRSADRWNMGAIVACNRDRSQATVRERGHLEGLAV